MSAVLGAAIDAGALLDDYLDHVGGLGLSGRAMRDRTRIARDFLSANPDLASWMTLPARERSAELQSSGAWPLLCCAIGTGRLRLDVELAAVKQLTGLGAAVQARDPAGFTPLRDAGKRLGWKSSWIKTVLGECLAVMLAWHGGLVSDLAGDAIDAFDNALSASSIPRSSWRAYRARLASLRQLLYEVHVLDAAPRRRPWARSLEQRFTDVAMAAPIRDTLLRYIRVRVAVLRPKSVESLINDLLPFAEYLTAHHPQLTSPRELDRTCIEGYLAWNRTRGWRGQRAAAGAGRTVSAAVAQSAVLSLRNLLDDITAWGWEQAPARRLVFAADVPKLDQPLPRALSPDVDTAVMNAVARLDDPFARVGLTVQRGAGLRAGELLDLELASIIDYGAAGTWLKVPLGKLATERMVPLSRLRSPRSTNGPPTMTCTDRCHIRAPPCSPTFCSPSTGAAWATPGYATRCWPPPNPPGCAPGGAPLVITPHQLRHTWATELANAGMSLQALMALLGHVTPQMTIRYATLASPTLRAAYDEAMGKMRRQFTLTPVGRPILPDKISWLHSEMLKTLVAHGYFPRHPAAGACPYANICETCDNYVTAPEFREALTDQLADVQALKVDAQSRGRTDEGARHDRVARALTDHLQHLNR